MSYWPNFVEALDARSLSKAINLALVILRSLLRSSSSAAVFSSCSVGSDRIKIKIYWSLKIKVYLCDVTSMISHPVQLTV